MKKRIFLGIPASSYIQKEVSNWQRKYLKEINVRKIESQNLHITLVPPWYCKDVELENGKISSFKSLPKPFDILFEKVEFAPKGQRPRLIWLQANTPKKLIELYNNLSTIYGYKENRPYKTHLTIARWNPKKTKMQKKEFPKISWKMSVTFICIFESVLKAGGAQYKILHKVKLRTN